MRNIEVELVEYHKDKLLHVSSRFLHMFAEYSDIPQTGHFTKGFPYLKSVIEQQEPTELNFNAEGIVVVFSGFKPPTIRASFVEGQDPRLVAKAPEPYFAIRENFGDILPSKRNHTIAVTNSILQEMQDVYHVAREYEPSRIIFTHNHYAATVRTEQAVLL